MDTAENQTNYDRPLKKRWMDLKNRREELLKTMCPEIANIPNVFNLPHVDCQGIILLERDYCQASCEYYKDRIQPIEQELKEIRDSHPAFLDEVQ